MLVTLGDVLLRQRPWVWRLVLGMFALFLPGVVSCSGSEPRGATPPPPTTTRASASGSPSPSASGLPTATDVALPTINGGSDQAGEERFVRAYFAELDRAFATGDTSRVAAFREPGCQCLQFEQKIHNVYGSGGRIVGHDTQITGFGLGQHGPAFAKVTAEFRAGRTTVISKTGEQTVVQEPIGGYYFLLLVQDGDKWQIREAYSQAPK